MWSAFFQIVSHTFHIVLLQLKKSTPYFSGQLCGGKTLTAKFPSEETSSISFLSRSNLLCHHTKMKAMFYGGLFPKMEDLGC